MFENNYNSETNTNEATYVPVAEVDMTETTKPKKKKKFLKVILGLFCVVAVSVGSITVYKDYKDGKDITSSDVTEKSEKKDNDLSTELISEIVPGTTYETTSLFQLSKSAQALSTQEIYKKMIPSVVGVKSTFTIQGSGFYGSSKQGQGTGTAIVISEDGYIVTNAHVVYSSKYNAATEISVLMHDETEYPAELIGYDVLSDIAVLKIEADGIVAAEIGDSSMLNVGDSAIAIGNPLGFDLFGTMTVGYISGLNREIDMDNAIMNLIQTDAAINSGNSGGPLINDCGQVIGINSMKMSNSYLSTDEATIEGLGFAIPINDAMNIVNDLINVGYVTGRPSIGLTGMAVTQAERYAADGIYVDSVNKGSAAEKAGILSGDIIVAANGESVTDVDMLNKIKNKFSAGDTFTLTIVRDRKFIYVDVVLDEVKQETTVSVETPETEPQQQIPGQQQSPQDVLPGEIPGDNYYGYDDFSEFEDFLEEWWNEYSRR